MIFGRVRRLVISTTIGLFGLGAVVLSASPASAGSCGTWTPCGEVGNNSAWTMQVSLTWREGPHHCDVWNGNGGSTAAWEYNWCTQENLSSGGHRGGGNVDVDLFTFNSRDYILNFHGAQTWKTRGVWTRIQNNEGAYCYTHPSFGVPVCEVVYE